MAASRAKAEKGSRVVLVGAGGEPLGRWPMVWWPRECHLTNRTPERAEALADALGQHPFPGAPVTTGAVTGLLDLTRDDASVNCASAGMEDAPASPFAEELLHPWLVVMDIVYSPLTTQLLAAAERRGCATADGARILQFQACRQFEVCTSAVPPGPEMDQVLSRGIGSD
ncbi:MAG: hypothetical protein JW751_23125 [Polyangiaceae bacterium]|nr:hypothetical protein [Polyangiaceae bacterium]